jgi:hypothetical protein
LKSSQCLLLVLRYRFSATSSFGIDFRVRQNLSIVSYMMQSPRDTSKRVYLDDESKFELWNQQIQDFAMSFADEGLGHSVYGLVGFILSELVYARDFSDAPPFELITAEFPAPTANDDIEHWKILAKHRADTFKAQGKAKAELRAFILDTVPSEVFLQLRTAQGLATVTTAQLFAAVTDKYSQASPEMLAKVQLPLHTKFTTGDKLDSHLTAHVLAHKASERLNCTILDHDKVRLFLASLSSTGAWSSYIEEFQARYTTVKTRTWAKVMKKFPRYDVRRLNQATTSHEAGFAGAAQLEQLTATNVQLQAQINELKAVVLAATASQPDTKEESRGKNGGGGGRTRQQALAQYCWSHGPNPTHCSGDCRSHRLPTHDKNATLRDQRGGAPFYWTLRRERAGDCPSLPHN